MAKTMKITLRWKHRRAHGPRLAFKPPPSRNVDSLLRSHTLKKGQKKQKQMPKKCHADYDIKHHLPDKNVEFKDMYNTCFKGLPENGL